MEKMYKRLGKYALDPDNKKLYHGRAAQRSEYSEKWQAYHEKLLAKAVNSGIIKAAIVKTTVNDVRYIGKIDKEIYKCVTDDITTDEVIITDERIAHIKEKHPNDYEMYRRFLTESVENPSISLKLISLTQH